MKEITSAQWHMAWSELHAWIDAHAAAESPNNTRPCPLCGAVCILAFGRHTGRWRWHHAQSSCVNAHLDRKNWQEKYQWSLESEMFKTEL